MEETERSEEFEAAVSADKAFFTGCLPPAAILTLTREYVTVLIIRTAYAKVQLRLQVLLSITTC